MENVALRSYNPIYNDINTKQISKAQFVDYGTPDDSVEISIKSNVNENNTKVSFKEGLSLIGKGFVNKAKSLGKSIVKHPLKTAAIAAGTSLAIAALPLIGISSAAGASVLALGCAGIAVGKTAVHAFKAVNHNKNGEYSELRNDLEKIGGDTLDLALSLPFAPKAMKNLQRNVKFAPTVGLNKELLANIKNAKGIGAKYTELLKGDLRINYETIGNEMGLKTKPKLVFDDTMQFDINIKHIEKSQTVAGEYEPTTGVIKINPKALNPLAKIFTGANPEAILRHELTHFQQLSDIARSKGVAGLQDLLTEYYKEALKSGALAKDNYNYAQNMVNGDKSVFNSEFYETIVQEQGTIASGTQEAANAQIYADGWIAKVTTDLDKLKRSISYFEPELTQNVKKMEIYKSNPLEKSAFAAQDLYTKEVLRFRPNTINDIAAAESVANEQK